MKFNYENQSGEMDFLFIDAKTKYWFVRAGKGAEYYKDFKTNNYIAIGDNEVNLSNLKAIEQKFKMIEDTKIEEYKKIFNETYIELLKSSTKFKDLDLTEQEEAIEKEKRSSTIAANKTFKFIEKMGVGDYVLIPYKSSEYFLLGIILSDVYDNEIHHTYLGENDEYPISDYDKKRTVLWIKEIPFKDLPDQVNWILQGNRAIFDISQYAEQINPLISNQYIYKDKIYMRIDVGTEERVDSQTWLYYQSTIVKNADTIANKIFQKNKVQSAGQTVLETIIENWETFAVIAIALFTDADIKIKECTFKWHGPLAFLNPQIRKKRKHEEQIDALELKQIEQDLETKELTNQRMRIENKILLNSSYTSEHEETSKNISEVTKTVEEQKALEKMHISNKAIGRDISLEKQMDNLFDFDGE
ncbi:hypothetical protein [Aerococcus tenax]|uniref:hypothetical protein n=1 Tax=Aerococcus tenax TaxID=3078812 RepID=UPI0018A70F50|nr:hypothetical protein [Aerococcus tenax]